MWKSYRTEEHPVKVSLFGVDLESKSSRISNTICRAFFSYDGREAAKEASLLTHFFQKIRFGEIRDVVGHFKYAIGSSTFGMDSTTK